MDIHGKITDEIFLDVGVAHLERLWPSMHQRFVAACKCQLARNFDEVLLQCQAYGPRGNLITVQSDPILNGYRSDGFATLSMQTAMLGVPSVQLEFPSMLRSRLLIDVGMCQQLAKCIADVHHQDVVPWHQGAADQYADVDRLRTSLEASHVNTQTKVETDDEDFALCMLSGMVQASSASDHIEEPVVSNEESQFPVVRICEKCAKHATGSHDMNGRDFSDWSATLLRAFLEWDKSHGGSCDDV